MTSQEYYAKNKEKIQRYHRINYEKNKTKMREYRKQSKIRLGDKARREKAEWKRANPEKCRAWEAAKRLVPLKDKCEICGGTEDLEKHHKDYGKPLEVLTLCRICHNALELIEPSVCTKQPDIRYYRGGEPVEVMEHTPNTLGWRGRWPCKFIRTGEVRELFIGHLYYLPKGEKTN